MQLTRFIIISIYANECGEIAESGVLTVAEIIIE
jgi:hypothetical protein